MKMHKSDSSYLASTGYDSKARAMRVRFTDGYIADYFEISPQTYNAIASADSPGEAFTRLVRDKYAFKVVRKAA
jgi:hypothetical protein